MSDIDSYTKRKAPNAYVLFTTSYMNQYKVDHPNDSHRFHGGMQNAIGDPMIVRAWEALPPEMKQIWKEKAREEKSKMVNEFSYRLEQYVSVKERGPSELMSDAEANGGPSNVWGINGGASSEPTQQLPGSTTIARAHSLKRLLRNKKNRKKLEDSKYAPSFFDEITTAKQFEEKRRRERNCLVEIWGWRTERNKDPILDEPFFLVSSQSFDVQGDMHAPGTISCLEFTIREGVKREFCCNISENYSEWVNGTCPDLYDEFDCNVTQPPEPICRELSEWLRATHKDLSSKTPIFFCLVEEYAETFDCLSILFSYKEGSSMRFQPYLLATTDDLVNSLLRFFEVPTSSGNATTSFDDRPSASAFASRPQVDSFQLSRVIDRFYIEMAKVHACEFHRSEIEALEQSVGGGDGFVVDKNNRCPLAVVRACAAYTKKWVESGRIDDRVQTASSPKSTNETDEKGKSPRSYTESVKSEDIDRFSYLNLSTGDGSDRTVGNGSESTSKQRRGTPSDITAASDVSDDVIEMNPQESSDEASSVVAAIAPQSTSVRPSTIDEVSIRSVSCANSHSSVVANVQPLSPMRQPSTASASQQVSSIVLNSGVDGGGVVSGVGWTADFRAMYEAQQRLPFGSRGLGRGMRFDLVTDVPGGEQDLMQF